MKQEKRKGGAVWLWEEVKQRNVGGFRAVFECGAGADHRLCPETFGITLRTPLEGTQIILSWCPAEFPGMCTPERQLCSLPKNLGSFLGL